MTMAGMGGIELHRIIEWTHAIGSTFLYVEPIAYGISSWGTDPADYLPLTGVLLRPNDSGAVLLS